MDGPVPQLVFFTELDAPRLEELLAQPGVVETLRRHEYGLSMAIRDFSPSGAEAVRVLEAEGIGVTAWLLLPADAGYWFNVENYPQATAYYRAFSAWARSEQLRFNAVALGLEPSPQLREGLRYSFPLWLARRLVAARTNSLFPAAQVAYRELTAEIRADGYAVHTYQYPFVVDDRRAGTTLVQRALNIVDLPADTEVLLCYSSRFPRLLFRGDLGGALVAEYGPHADAIGVGLTGGGYLDATGRDRGLLSFEALARDLRLAAGFTDTIHIFSLEGCVEQGYLERLPELDWTADVRVLRRYRLGMSTVRMAIGATLWTSRHGLTMLGWVGWVVAGAMVVRRALERARSRD